MHAVFDLCIYMAMCAACAVCVYMTCELRRWLPILVAEAFPIPPAVFKCAFRGIVPL